MLCRRFVPRAMKLERSGHPDPDLYFWKSHDRAGPHFLDKAWRMLLQVVC